MVSCNIQKHSKIDQESDFEVSISDNVVLIAKETFVAEIWLRFDHLHQKLSRSFLWSSRLLFVLFPFSCDHLSVLSGFSFAFVTLLLSVPAETAETRKFIRQELNTQ